MASTEQTQQLEPVFTGYPVDAIMENTNCELHFKMKNISMKVADAIAFSNSPEATFHCNPIPAGYACVLVDEVVDP